VLPNKNKTVSPLIIPKSRIQSVPNQSAEKIQENNSNDGWITPTPTKTQSNLSKCIIKIKQTVYNSKSLCTILRQSARSN